MKGKGLLTGMGVTLKHFFGKKVTMQYPEERVAMTERFRGGKLALDEQKCISCKLCSMACPNKALSLDVSVDAEKKRHMQSYKHHSNRCLYCNLCLEACPTHALSWDKNYELATYRKSDMDYDCVQPKKAQEVKSDE